MVSHTDHTPGPAVWMEASPSQNVLPQQIWTGQANAVNTLGLCTGTVINKRSIPSGSSGAVLLSSQHRCSSVVLSFTQSTWQSPYTCGHGWKVSPRATQSLGLEPWITYNRSSHLYASSVRLWHCGKTSCESEKPGFNSAAPPLIS